MSESASTALERTGAGPSTAPPIVGEVLSPVHELSDSWVATLEREQTRDTYRRALGRFARWLGPAAPLEELSLEVVSAYHAELVGRGLATSTIRKDRAALNAFVRWAADHDYLDARQARLALSVQLPRPSAQDPEVPKHLSASLYAELLAHAEAVVARDALRGWRDVALLRVMGDAGLRCEELVRLERRDFLPRREGSSLRRLDVRHGKGDHTRKVGLTPAATNALVRWERERARARAAGVPLRGSDAGDRLFVTLGRRRAGGGAPRYTHAGGPATHAMVDDVVKRLGRRAGIPEELRHPHVLRHTFATLFYRRTRDLAALQRMLGHRDPKTTMVYVGHDADEEDRVLERFAGGALTLEQDAAAA